MERRIKALAVVFAVGVMAGCHRSPEAKSAAYVEAGKQLLAKHDPNRAILQFLNAAKATPRNADVYYQLGLAYLAAGDLSKGVKSLRKTLELNPHHVEAQLRISQLEIATNDPLALEDAKKRLQELIQSDSDPNALHALALTELKLGAPETAAQYLEEAAAAAPGDLAIQVTLAETKLQKHDLAGAEQVLRDACQKAPDSADARVVMGRFYEIRKNYPAAEREFRAALQIKSDSIPALVNLAALKSALGDQQTALDNYKRLSLLPDKSVNFMYGVFLFQQGRKDEAVGEFQRLAKLNSDDRTVRTRLVAALSESGRSAEAEKIIAGALKKNSSDLDALLQRAELEMSQRKYQDAENDLNRVLHFKPDSAEVHYGLAKLDELVGKPDRERQELYESLRLNPGLIRVRLEAAKLLIAQNDGATALALLDSAPENQKELLPTIEQRNWALLATRREAEARSGVERGLAISRTPDLLLQQAVLQFASKRYSEARDLIGEELAKNPEDIRALRVLIGTYVAQNQPDKAVAAVRKHVEQHPQSATLQLFLGRLLMDAGDRNGAMKVLSSLRSTDPNFQAADLAVAQIDLLQSKWTDARQELNTILSKKGESAQARQWLGMIEAGAGNQSAAIEDFRKVVALQPDNAIAMNNLAFLLAEQGKVDEALPFAEKAVSLAADRADFEDTLGWVLYRKGLYGPAVTHLKSAVSKATDPRFQYHLAAAYFRNGDENEGQVVLAAALRANPNLPEAALAQQAARQTGRQE